MRTETFTTTLRLIGIALLLSACGTKTALTPPPRPAPVQSKAATPAPVPPVDHNSAAAAAPTIPPVQ